MALLRPLAALSLLLGVVACGSDEPTAPAPAPAPAAVTTDLSGRAISADSGTPQSGIKVSVGDRSTFTAEDGSWRLDAVPVDAGTRLRFAGIGLASTWMPAQPAPDGALHDAYLQTYGGYSPFSGGPVWVTRNWVVADSGEPASLDQASVRATAFTPGADPRVIGIGYRIGGTDTSLLDMIGAVAIEVTDAQGRELRPVEGGQGPMAALLTIPVDTKHPTLTFYDPEARIFRLDVAAGRWMLVGKPYGWAPGLPDKARFRLDAGQRLGTFAVGRVAPALPLHGCVMRPDGTPVAGAVVEAHATQRATRATARTDAQGQFRLPVVADGPSRVYAWAADGAWAWRDMSPVDGRVDGRDCLRIANADRPLLLRPLHTPRVVRAYSEYPYNDPYSRLEMSVVGLGAGKPVAFQWFRDGEPVPDAVTNSFFDWQFTEFPDFDQHVYHVELRYEGSTAVTRSGGVVPR